MWHTSAGRGTARRAPVTGNRGATQGRIGRASRAVTERSIKSLFYSCSKTGFSAEMIPGRLCALCPSRVTHRLVEVHKPEDQNGGQHRRFTLLGVLICCPGPQPVEPCPSNSTLAALPCGNPALKLGERDPLSHLHLPPVARALGRFPFAFAPLDWRGSWQR